MYKRLVLSLLLILTLQDLTFAEARTRDRKKHNQKEGLVIDKTCPNENYALDLLHDEYILSTNLNGENYNFRLKIKDKFFDSGLFKYTIDDLPLNKSFDAGVGVNYYSVISFDLPIPTRLLENSDVFLVSHWYCRGSIDSDEKITGFCTSTDYDEDGNIKGYGSEFSAVPVL